MAVDRPAEGRHLEREPGEPAVRCSRTESGRMVQLEYELREDLPNVVPSEPFVCSLAFELGSTVSCSDGDHRFTLSVDSSVADQVDERIRGALPDAIRAGRPDLEEDIRFEDRTPEQAG